MASAGDVLVSIGVDISDFAEQLEGMQSHFEKLGQKFSETGRTLSLAITAPLAGIGAIALKTFGDFEATMNKVNSLAGLTGGEFAKLKEQALDLGAKTQFSAKQAADAMAELAAAGFNATEIYKAMPGTLALAAAGQLKLGDAAQIASSILKGFGFEAEKIGDVANVLAAAANASAASVQDLGSSFKYVGPVASAVGVSFTETAAALAILANSGIKGEMGGTALRNMMSDLIAPSKLAAKEIQSLGIQVTDASGKFLPMADVIKNLAPLQNNLSAGFKIFGVRFSEVLPLLKAGSEEFSKLEQSMTQASKNKAAEVMAQDLFKGWNAALESFTGSVETTLIKIGDVLAKPAGVIFKNFFEPFMNWLGQMADAFGKLPMPIQTATLALLGIVTAAGPVIFVGGQIMEAFASLKLLGPILQGVGGYFTNLGTVVKDVGTVLATQFSGANIMALGNSMKASFAGLAASAAAGLKGLPAAATGAISAFSAALTTGIAGLGPKISTMFASLGPAITGGLASITSAVSGLSMAGMWSSIVAGFSTAATAIAGFAAAAAPLAAVIAAVVAAIAAIGVAIYEVIKWWDNITDVIGSFVNDVGKLFLGWVEAAFGAGAASQVASFFSALKTAVMSVPSAIRGMWSVLMDSVENALRWMVDKAAGVAKAFNLTETAKSLENWRNEIDKSKNALEGLTKQAGGVGPALASGFTFKGLGDATAAVEGLHKQVIATIDAVKTDITFYGAKNAAKDADALRATLGQLQQAFNGINSAQKAHLITDQEAAALKSKLAGEVQSVKGALANLEGQANRTGVSIEAHGKKVKAVKDVYKEWKDKVADVIEDVAQNWDEFNARIASGDNGKQALTKMGEQFRDLGREIEKTLDQNVKDKLIALQRELKTHIDQYEQWGRAIQDAKIREQLEQMEQAVNKIRATKAVENIKNDLAGLLQPFKEIEEAAKTMGIEIGNVFDASQMNVWEQNLKKAQDAYKLLNDQSTNLNLTEQQRQTILENLQKAQEDYNLAAFGGIDGLIKKVQELSDVFEAAGIDGGPQIKWDAMVYDAEQAFKRVVDSGQATNQQLYLGWLNLQQKKVDADADALKRLIENGASLGQTWGKTLDVAFKQAVLDVNKGVENMKKVINDGFSNVFTKLFEGDLKGAASALRKFGGDALDSLKGAFLKPFQDMFARVLSTVTGQITNFVTDALFGNLLGGLNKVFGGQGLTSLTDIGTKLAGSAKTTVAAAQALATGVDTAGKAIDTASKSVNTATGAMKAAGDGMASATNAVSSGVQTATKSIASGFSAVIGVASGVVSAVTGVLSYLQGRRMEQDIGRIEVTSRGMLSQLISLQETFNKYLPYLDNLPWLQAIAGNGGPADTDSGNRIIQLLEEHLPVIANSTNSTSQFLWENAEYHFKELTGAVVALAGAWSGADGAGVEALAEAIQRMSESARTAAKNTSDTSDALGRTATSANNAVPATQNLNTALETVGTSVQGATSNWAAAGESAQKAAGVAGESFSNLVISIKFNGEKIQEQTRGIFANIGDGMSGVLGPAKKAQESLNGVTIEIGRTGETASQTAETVKTASERAWTAAGTVGVAFENGAVKMTNFTAEAEAAARAAWEASGATEALSDATEGLMSAAQVTQENIQELVNTLFTTPESLKLTDAALQKVTASSEYASRKLQDIGKSSEELARQAGVTTTAAQGLTTAQTEQGSSAVGAAGATQGLTQSVHTYTEAVSSSAAGVAGSAMMVGPALQQITSVVDTMAGVIAGSAMSLGQVSVMTTDPVNALAQSVGNLGAAAGFAAGGIAGAAASMGSALVGNGGPSYSPPKTPATTPTALPPITPGPKADPRELSLQEFQAKGFTAGMQGPGGGIIPYGANGQPIGMEPPVTAPQAVPNFTDGIPSWGTADQLWGQTIGGGPLPSMADTNAPIGINVNVNNADADDIAQTIIDRLHGAGY